MKGSPIVFVGAFILAGALMFADIVITNYIQSITQPQETLNKDARN